MGIDQSGQRFEIRCFKSGAAEPGKIAVSGMGAWNLSRASMAFSLSFL